MSTTIPSASTSTRRNVASTTKVAPCRRCAGPKTSPRKLWAIIMWSRTVTLNIGSALLGVVLGVPHPVAQTGQLAARQPGQHHRHLGEFSPAGDERVEGR